MSSSVTSKFKKGDKILGVSLESLGMFEGKAYTVRTCVEGSMTLEECFSKETGHYYTFTPSAYELVEKRDYRKMKPTDLITINIDGNESEVPLGDLVHATRLLGVTNGFYGARIWEALYNVLGEDGFRLDNTVIEFRDKQKETLDYFFKPYYDKQQQEKEELHNLISKKQNELDKLVEKLNQM